MVRDLQPATKEFKPDRVPVYCKCEMPYNPDQFMVMCIQCEEWCVSSSAFPLLIASRIVAINIPLHMLVLASMLYVSIVMK